jgi:DNA polymerase
MTVTKPRPVSRAAQLQQVREAARDCRNCPLWKRGTQTVFGAGPASADVVLVGEQPGDQEDRQGEPFVGPAGRVLREALVEAGLDVSRVYLTNAVKHFKWIARGKRRIHEKPNREEILACRIWLDQELALIKPKAVVALGATAASVIAPGAKVTKDRGRALESTLAPIVAVTVHPSSILRAPDDAARRQARHAFTADLKAIARLLGRSHKGAARATSVT